MDHNPMHGPEQQSSGLASDPLVRACAHLDAAAAQLTAEAGNAPFATRRLVAGQLSLLRGGLHPGIRAVPDATDTRGPLEHVAAALALLDAIPRADAPADLLVWISRLAALEPAVSAASAENHQDTPRAGRTDRS